MPRVARVVVPKIPHHVTQRGNRRQQTFFCQNDYERYIEYLASASKTYGVEIWAYCLMPNHIHLIAVPEEERSLTRTISETHERYTKSINFQRGWKGFLWQGRYSSFPMDEGYLAEAARYVELNPIRANICDSIDDYPWSSAQAHLSGADDKLVKVQPLLERYGNWREYLALPDSKENFDLIRERSRSGRPLGSDKFIENLEEVTGRVLRAQKRGRKARTLN